MKILFFTYFLLLSSVCLAQYDNNESFSQGGDIMVATNDSGELEVWSMLKDTKAFISFLDGDGVVTKDTVKLTYACDGYIRQLQPSSSPEARGVNKDWLPNWVLIEIHSYKSGIPIAPNRLVHIIQEFKNIKTQKNEK